MSEVTEFFERLTAHLVAADRLAEAAEPFSGEWYGSDAPMLQARKLRDALAAYRDTAKTSAAAENTEASSTDGGRSG